MGTQKLTMNSNWKRLNIAENKKELRIDRKVSFPSNLYLERRTHTPILYASWLPPEEDDPRPKTGKKRRAFQKSTGSDIPRQAALTSIYWVKEKQRELVDLVRKKEEEITEKSLADYWEIHLPDFIESKKNRNSFEKLVRDEKNKWNSPTYGLSKEEFAHKNVDLISRKDYESYFKTLSIGMQSQQKTLIKKLIEIAESDFIGHQFPSFPTITKPQKQQVKHFQRDEWEKLMGCINQLSGGFARENLSIEQYKELEYKQSNRKNHRNWVDLFDAIWVQYYWFLRSQDMEKLKIEWFRDESEHYEYVLTNQDPKSRRKIVETRNINPEGYKFFKRLLNRREEKGYLIFPHLERPVGNEADSSVLPTLNFLLKAAMEGSLPNVSSNARYWTTLRHTAFRLTLEENKALGVPPEINAFAENGHTSADQLRKTYLRFIDQEGTALKSREMIAPRKQVRWGGRFKSKKDIQ